VDKVALEKLTNEELRWFRDLLFSEIDSWFTADIACCESCYDDFVARWPLVYSANDAEFQKCGIPLTSLYRGSRLREEYSEEQFEVLIAEVDCPRCCRKLDSNIWIYNFPFDIDVEHVEEQFDEIAALAREAPFLLLRHPFAGEIESAIARAATGIVPKVLTYPACRARASLGITPAAFGRPPKEKTDEGRYNHAGRPVWYVSTDLQTAIEEMRKKPCSIAELRIGTPLRILDLVEVGSATKGEPIIGALCYSALVSARHDDVGQYRPHYVVSRFVADCARHSKIDAIRYPSTRSAPGHNVVILNDSVPEPCESDVVRYHVFDGTKTWELR
jgi:hypothetical protein